MPHPKTRTLFERVPVNGMAPPASLRGEPAAPPAEGASASRSFDEQMDRIALREISPETVVATFGRKRAFVSQLALR
jgi:hypothetical protein